MGDDPEKWMVMNLDEATAAYLECTDALLIGMNFLHNDLIEIHIR